MKGIKKMADKSKALETALQQIEKQYGADPLENPDYGKIINEKHLVRL